MTLVRIREKLARSWFGLRHAGRFAAMGSKSFIASPFRADGAGNMRIGLESFVQRGAWLYCEGIEGTPARLTIGDGCVFGYNNHITAVRHLRIGDHVLTANNVYISDNVHSYDDPQIPIMWQPVQFKKAVTIGDGSWLGENVCVIGASVGRNCVIGANAVVTRDIPDRCVAVGIPARVIRYFDDVTSQWKAGSGPTA